MGEVSKRLNAEGGSIDGAAVQPPQLAALIRRIADNTLLHAAARQVFDAWWQGDARDVDGLIDALGLRQMDDAQALAQIVDAVVAANDKSVAEFRAGKDRAFNALVGQVMKASRGKANPAQASALLKARLQR